MTVNRFEEIKRYIPFTSKEPGPDDIFWRIRPVIFIFHAVFHENGQETEHQAVDEMIIPFKGRHCKQYLKKQTEVLTWWLRHSRTNKKNALNFVEFWFKPYQVVYVNDRKSHFSDHSSKAVSLRYSYPYLFGQLIVGVGGHFGFQIFSDSGQFENITIPAIGFPLEHAITEKIMVSTYPGPPCIFILTAVSKLIFMKFIFLLQKKPFSMILPGSSA